VKRILVIKFGALGDFAQVFPTFQAIRGAHRESSITLLTTPAYEALAQATGFFDAIEIDGRPARKRDWIAMARRLRRARYDRVYDLQTSAGSTRLWWALLPRPPEWSGIARFGSHPQRRRDRNAMHNLDRLADQLHAAGVGPAYPYGAAPVPDLTFAVEASLRTTKALGFQTLSDRFGLRRPFALLIPGASASRPEKLWPADHYAALAAALCERGVGVAVAGGPEQTPLARIIAASAPVSVDLTAAELSQADFAALGAESLLCVGNDTGPTHMAAYAGAPGVMLFCTRVSDPSLYAPRAAMQVVSAADLADVEPKSVLERLMPLLPPSA